MLEFALTFVLVITIVLFMVEGFSLIHTYSLLSDAANEGLRYIIVNHADQVGATAKIRQFAALSMHDTSAMNVSFSYPDGGSSAPPNRVYVTVTYRYVPWLAGIMAHPPTLIGYAEGRMVY